MIFLGSIHAIRNQNNSQHSLLCCITLSVSNLTFLLTGDGKQDKNIHCFGVCDWWGAL